MHPQRQRFTRFCCLLLVLTLPVAAHGDDPALDWPHWSGPHGNLSADSHGTFERPHFALEELWKRPLGSAYSGLTVQGNKVVTGLADGDWDYLAAFETSTGEELWRYRIAKTYAGHDGSDDGPLGTPTIHGDRVYGVGPWGELFALDLASGKQVWTRQLGEAFGAPKPEYGFSTSPLVVDDLLIVQAGGKEGHSVVALDLKDGAVRWSVGEGGVIYQSPRLLELAGKSQIVAADSKMVVGLEPKSGTVLWQHPHPGGRSEFSHPVPIGPDRFLLSYWNETALFEVGREGESFKVSDVWHNGSLKGTYNLPVLHQDSLYGYSARFLVSVNAENGETTWKSRSPGAGNLVLVDDHLVILTASGEVVVVEAHPEAYREKARLQVLEKECYRAPVFAANRIFVRDLKHLAAVTVIDTHPLEPAAAPEG